jgi:nucleoside-diphosphate-sugar epimerase
MTTVFITGVTGFVGGAVAAELLKHKHVNKLIALVRARDCHHARERAVFSLLRFGDFGESFEKLHVVCGSLENFSLDAATFSGLTHVVHAAAHTSFLSVRTARATNIEGTKTLAAEMMRAPNLERFLYVGTAYRCGVVDACVIGEDAATSDSHVAEYTRTKSEAERALARFNGLPLVTARPSIVVGHTELGVAPSASLYWYYWGLALAGITPFPTLHRRDIVPVDWVASAIVNLLFKSNLREHCYHVSAGEASAVPWAQICETFARYGQAAPTTQYVGPAAFESQPAWTSLGLNRRTRLAFAACARFAAVPVEVFSNVRLLDEGIEAPPPFTGYLPRCIETNVKSLQAMVRDDV